MVQGVGFEPTKALPPELKSGPFDHSGTPAAHGRRNLVLNRAAPICPGNRGSAGTYDENSLTPCEQPRTVQESRNTHGRVKTARIALFLTLLMLAPIYSGQTYGSELQDADNTSNNAEATIELYTLYLASADSTTDGDGLITTKIPESGGQETASALDETIEFISQELLSSIEVFGRPNQGSGSGSYYLPIDLFLKAVGPSGSSVDWTINIKAGGSSIGEAEWSADACNTGIGNTCNFDHEEFEVDLGSTSSFMILEDETIEIMVSAEMSGCDSGGGPFGSTCTAELAWNEIDGESTRHSEIEVETNAISNSIVVLQRDGDEISEGPILEWYPNDIIDQRSMQFTFDVKSAFGRYDIDSVRLLLRDSQGTYRIDKEISDDDPDIDDTSQGIFGHYSWTYPGGVPSGEYSVELEVTDIQGNLVLIDHEPVEMRQFGVSINHGMDRQTEYIAPGEITPIPLQLVHRGDSTKSMSVELEVMTNLGSSWLVEFDSDSSLYSLDAGGDILNPVLTLQAPDDLTGTPSSIDIRAVSEAEVDGVLTVVHQDTLNIILEKIDVFQPPAVSIWDEDHSLPIANSTRPDDIDSSIPRYVEYGEFTPFLLEIFNTGFDADTFRIDVLKRSKSIIQVYDNNTGERILEDVGDGTFHSSYLERHSTQVLLLNIKPSNDRADDDVGLIEIEVTSSGNSSLRSTVLFSIQRTFGIRAEVSQDCDGSPLGQIDVSLCSPGSDNAEVDLRVRIISSANSGDTALWWRIQNPATLQENLDISSAYGQWQFRIEDENKDSVPRVSLSPGGFIEVAVTVTLTTQVEQGNHTIYLRIIEDTEESEPRYFDLPMTFEIDPDEPNLEIVQVTQDRKLLPGEEYSIQMKVKNEGNTEMTILLDAEVNEEGWRVEIEGPSGSTFIQLEAYEELSFNLKVTVPKDANNGDRIPVLVTAMPLAYVIDGTLDTSQSWSDDYTAKKTVYMTVDLGNIFDIVVNELSHPRPLTLIILVVGVLLIIAGIQSNFNRRRWASHMALIESMNEDDDLIEDGEDSDIPTPVKSSEDAPDTSRYADDDIELV
jgi:hypothetical protein|tara:strand:- start:1605 stop:4772 length:3168 start_codon:yes stop_codon:yes gene_type:complete